jgi:hypothetical protein
MITLGLIASSDCPGACCAGQGKWTRVDSWFAAVFALAMMAMVINQYVNHIN